MAAYFLFAVAMRNLRRQAACSALTTLGIVIGVAAVIAAVGIGSGAKAKVEKSLQKLNPNQISMMATMPSALKERMPVGGGLTLADYQAIKHEVGGIIAASPYSYPSPDVVRAKGKAAQGRHQLWVLAVQIGANQLGRGAPVHDEHLALAERARATFVGLPVAVVV